MNNFLGAGVIVPRMSATWLHRDDAGTEVTRAARLG